MIRPHDVVIYHLPTADAQSVKYNPTHPLISAAHSSIPVKIEISRLTAAIAIHAWHHAITTCKGDVTIPLCACIYTCGMHKCELACLPRIIPTAVRKITRTPKRFPRKWMKFASPTPHPPLSDPFPRVYLPSSNHNPQYLILLHYHHDLCTAVSRFLT